MVISMENTGNQAVFARMFSQKCRKSAVIAMSDKRFWEDGEIGQQCDAKVA